MSCLLPRHGRPCYLPPPLFSVTNNFNLTASSRHPGPGYINLPWWWEKIVISPLRLILYFTPLPGLGLAGWTITQQCQPVLSELSVS